jgi:hypothetical protein
MSIRFNVFTGTLDYIGNVSATGVTEINGQTGNNQTLVTGEAGTDFTIDSAGNVHTFNLPYANGSTSGKLRQTDWQLFNDKQEYKIEKKTLTLIDIANKYVVLEVLPRDAARVTMSIVSGPEQNNGIDFQMTAGNGGKRLSWDTLGLDGQLDSSDVIIVRYF